MGVGSLPLVAQTSNAEFMSGKWGIAYRINAGDEKLPSSIVENFDVSATVQQVKSLGASHVHINISNGAFGDRYIAPHSVLEKINPLATPERDLFGEIATQFKANGINVIAYMATQGPALIKHGATVAYDYNSDTGSSPALDRWRDYVLNDAYAGSTETEDQILKRAYAEIIVDEYAQRYAGVIDGWAFDHASHGNIPLIAETIRKYQPNTALSFNDGVKVPLTNNSPGIEDFTFGHPNPVKNTLSNSLDNLGMLTSIENSQDGYISDTSGFATLGHMYLPLHEKWNGGDLIWDQEQALDWRDRALAAGGSWTWAVPNDRTNRALIRSDSYEFLASLNNVPEPSSTLLLASSLLITLTRRKRASLA